MKMKNTMKSTLNVTNNSNDNEYSAGNSKIQARVSVSGYADINRKTNVATVAASFAKMKENMSHCLSGNNTHTTQHTTHTHAQHTTSSLERRKKFEKSSFKDRENSGEKTTAKSVILAGGIFAKLPISKTTKVEEVDKTKKCVTVVVKENKSEMKGEEGEEEEVENADESFLEDYDDDEDEDDEDDDYSGDGENDESFYPDQEEEEDDEEEEEEERGRRKKRSSQTKRTHLNSRLSGEINDIEEEGCAQNGGDNGDIGEAVEEAEEERKEDEEEGEQEEEEDDSSDDEERDEEDDDSEEEEEREVNRRKKKELKIVNESHRQQKDREVEVLVEEEDDKKEEDLEERDKEEKIMEEGCIDLSSSPNHSTDTTPTDVCKDSIVSQTKSKNISNTYHSITMSSSLFTNKPLKITNTAPSSVTVIHDNPKVETTETKSTENMSTEILKPLQTYTVKELQSLLKARKLTISGTE